MYEAYTNDTNWTLIKTDLGSLGVILLLAVIFIKLKAEKFKK